MEQVLPGLHHALNVHPLFVHFPIVLWAFALLLWSLGQFLDRSDFLAAGRFALYAGTLGALVAVATGFVASNGLGHHSPGHDFVHLHRAFMLSATAAGVVTTLLAVFLRGRPAGGARWVVTAALALTVVVTTLGADRGAMLVYRFGMGTAVQPRALAGDDHDHSGSQEEMDDHDHGEEHEHEHEHGDDHDHDH